MADNTDLNAGTGGDKVVTREISHGGDTAKLQGVFAMGISGNEGSYTAAAIGGDATNGLDVDVTRSALPTGASTSANQTTIIGHLDGVEGLLTTIDADTGSLAGCVAGTELQVDIVGGGITGRAEDSAHSTGHEGVVLLAVRRDTAAVGSDTDGDYSTVNVDASGRVWTAAVQSGTWTVQPGNTANTTAWLVSPRPATAGGLTIFRSIDLDETEEEIKATAGQLYGYYFANTNAAARYLKFYNATAANVTVGTTTPVLTFYLPASSAGHVEFSHGIAFSTAITAAATTGVADNDTGAPSANDVILNAFYA